LDNRGIIDPAKIGAALGMPAAEATKLLNRHQWRDGDVARLQARAASVTGRALAPQSPWLPRHSHTRLTQPPRWMIAPGKVTA
jgi:hypothetical protein